MKIKFTSREKKMLSGLILLIVIAAFYQFVFVPVSTEYAITTDLYQSISSEKDKVEGDILDDKALKDKIHELQRVSKILTKQLPPEVNQEYIVMDVLSIFTKNETELLSLSFDGDENPVEKPKVESVDDALAIYEASMDTKTDKINELKGMFSGDKTSESGEKEEELPISTLVLDISCRGHYSNIKNIIKDIDALENLVIVKEITLAKERESLNAVQANIILEFPYFADNSSYELEAWKSLEKKGEDVDPFTYFIRGSKVDPNVPKTTGASKPANVSVLTPKKVESKVDFFMTARTKASDDFAFTIGKNGDASSRVTSDVGQEEIDLRFVDYNGKVAYMIGSRLRPITENKIPVTFTPLSSKIIVEINSQPRVNDKDDTKAIVKVKNTSSVPIEIVIKNDDKNNPRIVVMKEGNVTVK